METVAAQYDSHQAWLNLRTDWSETLFSQTVLSEGQVERERTGSTADNEDGTLDIDDQPMELRGSNVRIAELMALPGPGDHQRCGVHGVPRVVQSVGKLARLQSGQLDPLVSMPRKSPVLILPGVPVAQVLHRGDFIGGN